METTTSKKEIETLYYSAVEEKDKTDWSSLVDMYWENARDAIKAKDSNYWCEVVFPNQMVHEDYCTTRVILYVDDNGVVLQRPYNG
jgi:hypothetical protein